MLLGCGRLKRTTMVFLSPVMWWFEDICQPSWPGCKHHLLTSSRVPWAYVGSSGLSPSGAHTVSCLTHPQRMGNPPSGNMAETVLSLPWKQCQWDRQWPSAFSIPLPYLFSSLVVWPSHWLSELLYHFQQNSFLFKSTKNSLKTHIHRMKNWLSHWPCPLGDQRLNGRKKQYSQDIYCVSI